MNTGNPILLSSIEIEKAPFPHFVSTVALYNNIAVDLFDWFEKTNEWILAETEFYEQYEINMLAAKLPPHLSRLKGDETISVIKTIFKSTFKCSELDLVGITAHKLVEGQKIGIHNDYIDGEETHRLVIHLNPNWVDSNGGYLMLFNSEDVQSVSKIFAPINNFAFGFEISESSHHAVSKVSDYLRYTFIYTFKAH